MSSPKSVVGDPEPKSMDSRQQSAGMTKGDSLVLSWVEGLLLCIKTKKIERRLIQMREKLIKIPSSN
jgi:hypothetical protein